MTFMACTMNTYGLTHSEDFTHKHAHHLTRSFTEMSPRTPRMISHQKWKENSSDDCVKCSEKIKFIIGHGRLMKTMNSCSIIPTTPRWSVTPHSWPIFGERKILESKFLCPIRCIVLGEKMEVRFQGQLCNELKRLSEKYY